jgi:CBS domain containing-hemolysin-like protein
VKDLVDRFAADGTVWLERLIRPALQVQDDLPADRVLALLRERRAHSAIVIDRAGHALGLVTIQDLLGQLLGLSRTPGAAAPPDRSKRGRA